MSDIKINNSWLGELQSEFETTRMKSLLKFLNKESASGKNIYPNPELYFQALNLTPIKNVKVVLLGQDPYHGPNQAHGLCFSVATGVRHPPSLQNIFKELKDDLGIAIPVSGDLSHWAKQGVLMLNSVLTVEAEMAASHQKKGWEEFTDKVIHVVNEKCDNVVFILWGSYAQKKAGFVDSKRHLVLQSVHPSPLSSYRGFFGSKPFSKTNDWLKLKKIKPIEW
ncbi:MAG: uracil-DNA glycosylase [Pseudobdellovibrio sp.]